MKSHRAIKPLRIPDEVRKNVNPKLEHLFSSDQLEWLRVANTSSELKVTDERFVSFFRSVFRLLEINNMCFSSGAFVIEDSGYTLFNLLTFDQFIVESNSYLCEHPLTPLDSSLVANPNVHILPTETHDGFYKKHVDKKIMRIDPHICIPKTSMTLFDDQSKTKFERIFQPKMKNLCGYCKKSGEHSESKGVVLYYPFKVTSKTYPIERLRSIHSVTDMLYLKLEASSVTSEPVSHTKHFLMSTVGLKKKYAGLDIRKEDDTKCNYETKYLQKDMMFYEKYCPEDLGILAWYNTHVRIGCEFFVSKNLLMYFYKTFLYTQFSCEHEAHHGDESPVAAVDGKEKAGHSGRGRGHGRLTRKRMSRTVRGGSRKTRTRK
jgi:hypothetical protein